MRGINEFRAALDKHMKGVNGVPLELRDPFSEVAEIEQMMLGKPHSLREDHGMRDYLDIILGVSPEGPLCNCGRYHCPRCDIARELREAIDTEIERRKKRFHTPPPDLPSFPILDPRASEHEGTHDSITFR